MATATTPFPTVFPTTWTMADLQEHLGGIPAQRIRMHPPPGMATEQDVLQIDAHEDRICELIDGVLVEKTMGYGESILAGLILHFLHCYLAEHDRGILLAPDGTLKILADQVRIPDVSFIAWERFPNRQLPPDPIPAVAPDLAVEVLSKGNTEREMQRKLRDYFEAGTRLVWLVDPRSRSVRVYTSPEHVTVLGEDGTLDGGEVLPGFRLPLRTLFAKLPPST